MHGALSSLADQQTPTEYVRTPSAILTGVLVGGFLHFVGGRSWDALGERNGSQVLVDGIHLTDRSAHAVGSAVSNWMST